MNTRLCKFPTPFKPPELAKGVCAIIFETASTVIEMLHIRILRFLRL